MLRDAEACGDIVRSWALSGLDLAAGVYAARHAVPRLHGSGTITRNVAQDELRAILGRRQPHS
jgi:hypothetical protein